MTPIQERAVKASERLWSEVREWPWCAGVSVDGVPTDPHLILWVNFPVASEGTAWATAEGFTVYQRQRPK